MVCVYFNLYHMSKMASINQSDLRDLTRTEDLDQNTNQESAKGKWSLYYILYQVLHQGHKDQMELLYYSLLTPLFEILFPDTPLSH